MPSARARAAKAATAARIAAGALECASNDDEVTAGAGMGTATTTTRTMPGFFSAAANANKKKDAMASVVGHVDNNNTNNNNRATMMPMLPSMMLLNLDLNTGAKLGRALPVGAVVGGGELNGSDEENIQPGSSDVVTAEGAAGGHGSRPLSPMMLGKEVRAHEIERQREKKGAELAKRQARKAGGGGFGKREKVKANVMDVDIEEMLSMACGSGSGERKRTGTWEVSLSELVVHKKARKAEEDFEMVPRVRSVIVLDDGIDVDLDEPWEHVETQSLDEAAVAGASYASILTGAI